MRGWVGVALTSVIAIATPATLPAQWRADAAALFPRQVEPARPNSAVAPTLLSLAIPGAGQHVLGQDRKWLYLGLELAGWVLYVERSASGRDYRDRYRDLAWERGRIQSGPRVDGDFDYYERLSKWTRSGAFDADPVATGVQPEVDASTYNGSIWALASQIYLPPGPPVPVTDPSYQSALDYYRARAYGPELLWDWSGAPEAQRELGRLISTSDSRFRQARTAVGVVIVNHLLAAGDAYLSSRGRSSPVRVRFLPGSLARTGGRSEGPRPGYPGEWFAVVSLAVGR